MVNNKFLCSRKTKILILIVMSQLQTLFRATVLVAIWDMPKIIREHARTSN